MYPGIQVHEAALAVDWQFALMPQGEGLHGSITSGRTVAKTDFSREKKTTKKAARSFPLNQTMYFKESLRISSVQLLCYVQDRYPRPKRTGTGLRKVPSALSNYFSHFYTCNYLSLFSESVL